MAEFIGEDIEVQVEKSSPRPVSFSWRGETHAVAELLDEWVDAGFGQLPPGSRKWWNRRHRRYFVVKDESGDVFEMYMDYTGHSRTWRLVEKRPTPPQSDSPSVGR